MMKFFVIFFFCTFAMPTGAAAADATEIQLQQNLMEAITGGNTRRIDAAREALKEYKSNGTLTTPKQLTPQQILEKQLKLERLDLLRLQERISAAKNATLTGVENPYASEKEIAKAARLGTVPKIKLLHNGNPANPSEIFLTEKFPPYTPINQSAIGELEIAAKASPGKPAIKILESGGRIVGKVVVIYTAGKFLYDIYSYDGTAFQKTVNAGNNLTHIPFTPDFSGMTSFFLQGPRYLQQQRNISLWQKINALTECLNQWNIQLAYQAYYKKWNVINAPAPTVKCAPESFLGMDTTRTIKNEKDAEAIRSDIEYYIKLYEKDADN